MGYDWDDKEAECYRLYVEERKSLDEVMEHWSRVGFNPSKRAFQTQFKRWDFPSKQSPAHKNEALVARVKELWEHNTSQKDMLRALNDEGFEIKERELMRVRAKNRWLLRVPNGMKTVGVQLTQQPAQQITKGLMQELEQAMLQESGQNPTQVPSQSAELRVPRESSPELDPEVRQKRKQRLDKLQAESDERWASRKRRRRTRGWAGLPADPPGPPRFPSETTIDESKHFLQLDNKTYQEVRDQFTRICREAGVIKKTIAGPEKWTEVKNHLISSNPHLSRVFWADDSIKSEQKQLSLDVICTDVTKRMRTLENRMTIAEAKNALAINPEESRQVRTAFYTLLKEDRFTSKLEAGDDHWIELKTQWIAGSELLQKVIAPGESDPNHQLKLRALEVLCRDVMKRLRDDQTKRDPSRKKQINIGPGPGPAKPRPGQASQSKTEIPPPTSVLSANTSTESYTNAETNALPSQSHYAPAAQMLPAQQAQQALSHADLQIDPSLLLAATATVTAASSTSHDHIQDHSNEPQHTYAYPPYPVAQPSAPIPVYFRLHASSEIQGAPKLWLSSLGSASVAEVRALAAREHVGAVCTRVEGVVQDIGGGGTEFAYVIDRDDELEGYLAHVSGAKVVFAVHLVKGY
ncbi:hypothetical protein M501DRAFT_1004114 [Patellaria atrata CBS 101060]|uniref:Clr5 domain-containing protein n=1 Tax=Patellaria atrata CBS 101060 TaxID=1346257 RepID=A0A9P4VQ53_9PEZI|nr:hypothetical protein M501DRAFT_1004114 [Patellaria atrata CBS 101060]